LAQAGCVLFVLAALASCTPPGLFTLRSGLDSLRVVVDTLNVRDSVSYRMLLDTRRELSEQRDILLSTRATTGSTTQEMYEQMGRLEGKLDEAMQRFDRNTSRTSTTSPAPGGGDPTQLYDQAAQDLTQGRYAMALQNFRQFVGKFPTHDLADNAQYGVGECFFAQSQFDSASVAYAAVDTNYPQGDKVPSALYKRALAEEKLGRDSVSRQILEDLVKRYPLAGESQLARERLGTSKRR
jgi:tol-pal system protein YbgF